MARFKGIDGLRGWLACLVMLHHVVIFGGLNSRYAILAPFDGIGEIAVSTFIIISGFVITHLLLKQPASYSAYLCRRLFRIYPVYIVCLVLGVFTTRLYIATFVTAPWGANAPMPQLAAMLLKHQTDSHFLPNMAAHVVMLQGVIPQNLVPGAPTAFLLPAWSLSLEWQFYLAAPAIFWALFRSSATRVTLAALAAISYGAFEAGAFGTYPQPSFLPGAAPLFAVGMVTRTLMVKTGKVEFLPFAAMLAACLFLVNSQQGRTAPFIIWAAFVWLMPLGRHGSVSNPTWVSKITEQLFDSRFARYLGSLSYPIYLVHLPAIHLVLSACVRYFHLDLRCSEVVLLMVVPVLTVVAADMLHRSVEVPLIKFGRSLLAKDASHSGVARSDTATFAPADRKG